MSRSIFTEEQKQFIRDNRESMKYADIASAIGASKQQVSSWIINNGLTGKKRGFITDYQKSYMRSHYLTLPYRDIGKRIGLTERQVCGWINNNLSTKRRVFNDSYFEKIDSCDKAYWLGFIYADGWISNNEFGIELQKRDSYMLHDLNKRLGGVHIISEKHTSAVIHKNKNVTEADSCTLRVYSKKLVSCLNSNGIAYRKSYSPDYPVVSSDLFVDFLRGFFDGDGALTISKKNNIIFSITGRNKDLFSYISNILLNNYGVHSRIYAHSSDGCYRLMCYRKSDVKILLDLLYSDRNCIKLLRKYKTYTSFYGLTPQECEC